MDVNSIFASALILLTFLTLIEVILCSNIAIRISGSIISQFFIKADMKHISKIISETSTQDSKSSKNSHNNPNRMNRINPVSWVYISLLICVLMYTFCMVTGCILCWITIYDEFLPILSLISSLFYYIARYIMLLIFIARLYFVFQHTKFKTKYAYFIILIILSSLGIIISIFGIIVYFYCEFGNKCGIDPESVVIICFGIYFTLDLTVTTVTMFKFRRNLLILFKERKNNRIINLAIRYTNLFFWCFISTFLFILIGVSLVGVFDPPRSIDVLLRNGFIYIDTLCNSLCLSMSIPYFGKNTYNKCCNKIHIFCYQKYTSKDIVSSKTDINIQ